MSEFWERLSTKHNIQLSKQQQEVVMHKDGAAIAIAVPGAGKSTAIVCRVAYLITECNVKPENILTLTFNKAAAIDMESRFNRLFKDICQNKVQFGTIHSFSYSILRDYFYKKNLQLPAIIEDKAKESNALKPLTNSPDINKSALLKKLYYEANFEYISEDKLEELTSTLNYVRNMIYLPENNFNNLQIDIPKFGVIYKMYEQYKKENNLIDFSDMLSRALEILQQNPDILNLYRKRYTYVQVDESQDTTPLHNSIIKLLVTPNNNIVFVGDDDQTIYGYMGSSPRTMLEYETNYPGIKKYYMERNYRSTKKIINLANLFIKKNTERYEKNMFTEKNEGKEPVLVKVPNEAEQYSYIVEQLKEESNLSEVAILYRTNMSSIPLADHLQKNGIPFYIRDAKPHFFKHWVVADIISFFKFSLDGRDIDSFANIYYKINSYINKSMFEFVVERRKSHKDTNLFDLVCDYPGIEAKQYERLQRFKKSFELLGEKGPCFAIEYIERGFKYKDYLNRHGNEQGYSTDYLSYIISILKTISNEMSTLEEFIFRLDNLKNAIELSSKNKNNNAVILSTLHSSKGLEFNRVFLIDMVEGSFPSYKSIESEKSGDNSLIEEERRLCYVGLTRGRNNVDIIVPLRKNNEKNLQSRFVYEIETLLVPSKVKIKTNIQKENLVEGTVIKHAKFGEGILIGFEDEKNIVIMFEKHGIKKLCLDVCINEKLLSLEK